MVPFRCLRILTVVTLVTVQRSHRRRREWKRPTSRRRQYRLAGVEKSMYRKNWEEATRAWKDGHKTSGAILMRDGLPGGRKADSSKCCFDWKVDKYGNIVKFKACCVAREYS